MESAVHDTKAVKILPDLYTSMINSFLFYKLHKNKTKDCIFFINSYFKEIYGRRKS